MKQNNKPLSDVEEGNENSQTMTKNKKTKKNTSTKSSTKKIQTRNNEQLTEIIHSLTGLKNEIKKLSANQKQLDLNVSQVCFSQQ